MRSADMGCGLRWVLVATTVCAWSAPVLAGGPLYVVPVGETLKPARWEGTVKVYTDRGDLGAVDHATANKLVASALAEWSSVPTSSFRAQVAGELANDITGANAGQVIGASNGGGIQVIYDQRGVNDRREFPKAAAGARETATLIPHDRIVGWPKHFHS